MTPAGDRLPVADPAAEQLEAIGRLAGGIAHDFNNILTAIIGFGTLLAAQVQHDEPASRNVQEVLDAADRASALTSQLLAFGRRQLLHPVAINLNEMLARGDAMLRSMMAEGIDLQIVCKPDLPPLSADRAQLESVLLNLVVNARDAMPGGGRLTIETSDVVLDQEYCDAHAGVRPGHYVRLTVSDTGPGISPEMQRRIFEPFFTTTETGKSGGLGLAPVYGIVKQSGGDIWVYSEQGIGTTFHVFLPVDVVASGSSRKPQASVSPVVPASGEATRGTETVLLVEDTDVIRRLTRQIIARAGYQVLEARDAEHALAVATGHDGHIHLLVTDIVMPGVNGVELARRLKAVRPDIGVLFMSGYTDSAVLRNELLSEDAAFLAKPYTPEDLLRKMREVLGAGT